MTSGAIQQGVPTNVLRALGWWPHDALRSMLAATPKSASSTVPSVSTKMLPACTKHQNLKPQCAVDSSVLKTNIQAPAASRYAVAEAAASGRPLSQPS